MMGKFTLKPCPEPFKVGNHFDEFLSHPFVLVVA
jgi:hypothetical protein